MTTSQKVSAELPIIRHALMPSVRLRKSYNTPSRAKQSMKDECDINQIMKQFRTSGLVAHNNQSEGNYTDLGTGVEYHDAMNVITQAQQTFDTLPAHLRDRFNNSPEKFLNFVSNEDNLDEMREMGLAVPSKPQEEVPGAVSPETPSTPVPEPAAPAADPPAPASDGA